MKVEVIALDHIYIAVRNLAASEAFYDPVMRFLDFPKGTVPVAGAAHLHYYNRVLQYTIRPARSDVSHDPYAAGPPTAYASRSWRRLSGVSGQGRPAPRDAGLRSRALGGMRGGRPWGFSPPT